MIKSIDKNTARQKRHQRTRDSVLGTSVCPRISVYRSNTHIYAQIVDDLSHKTLCSSSSVELKITDGNNIEGAKKVGADLAKKALKAGIKKAVFDRSGYLYHGRIKALADAAREAGLEF